MSPPLVNEPYGKEIQTAGSSGDSTLSMNTARDFRRISEEEDRMNEEAGREFRAQREKEAREIQRKHNSPTRWVRRPLDPPSLEQYKKTRSDAPSRSDSLDPAMANIIRQLSIGDLYNSQNYEHAVHRQLHLMSQAKAQLQLAGDVIREQLAIMERGASLGEVDASELPQSAATAEIVEKKSSISAIHEELRDQLLRFDDTIAEIAAKRTEGRMATLFEQLIEESEKADAALAEAQKQYDSLSAPDKEAVEKTTELVKKLRDVQSRSCCLFGCWDIHPAPLFDYQGIAVNRKDSTE